MITSCSRKNINAAYFVLYPSGDSYNRDRMQLQNYDTVYQGALYFAGYSAITGGTKEAGQVSIIRFK